MDILSQLGAFIESALNRPPEDQPTEGAQSLNHIPDETEQNELVQIGNEAKKNMQTHARPKKTAMRACYAYSHGQFIGDDLLPRPSTSGSQKDINKDRPQVFYPLTKQQLKQLFAKVKLTFFPDDENYCRIRGNDPTSAQFEDGLTEGFMYVLKEMQASEKLSQFIWNLCWSGNGEVLPYIKHRTIWEWKVENNQYVPYQIELDPEIEIETFNPIQFYLDPTASDIEYSKWAYYSVKKLQEMKDNPLFFNIDKLKDQAKRNIDKASKNNSLSIDTFNGLNSVFTDTEDNVDYDLYYFPYIKTQNHEYRNMMMGIGAESVLVRFHPNLFPRGINPAVHTTWMQDVDSQYGTGPAEDIKDLQKLINMIANYKIEVMSRMGNRFVIGPSVDMSNFWGIAGGVMKAENPGQDVVNLSGNYEEIAHLDNTIGVLKAEANQVAGGSETFQGASQIDYQKTATEIQVMEGNSVSVSREVIEHIGTTGIRPALERIMHLVGDVYTTPQKIRIDDEGIAQRLGAEEDPITGYKYFTVDFSILKNPELSFKVELMGTNPSQSKQAEVESLMRLAEGMGENPMVIYLLAPIFQKIGELQGMKNTDNMIKQLQEAVGRLMGGQVGPQQPGIPPAEAGMGASPSPGMDPNAQAPPGSQAPLQ